MLKRYQKYRESSIPYLKQIPTEWEEQRIQNIFDIVSDKGHTDNTLLSVFLNKGVILYTESNREQVHKPSNDLSNYQLVLPGDFVLNNQQAWRGSVGVSSYQGIISPAYYVLRQKRKIFDDKFLNYLTRSGVSVNQFLIASKGVGSIQRQIYVPHLENVILLIPPLQEQQQIVRYLDWKTSQINHLIHGYERLISLLEERKTAVINEAVTKGIRKGVAMKDSGVHWLKEIPSHWNMVYSKQLFALRKDRAFPEDEQLTSSQKYGIISQKKFMEIEGRRVTVVLKGEDILKHVEKGDFVISMRSFQGGLEYSYVSGKISSAYVMLIPHHEHVYDEYYKWLFKSPSYIKALQGTSDLIRDGQALRYANFAKVYLPQVPIEEQQEIAEYISENVRMIEKTMRPIQEQIEYLRERRTRLISDVVTGALDVRDVVVPEYVQEQDMEVTEDGDEYEGERAGETDC